MTEPISIIIVDDHEVVRNGLRGYLETLPEFNVVGEAASGEEALELVTELIPDVVLMDLIMPGMDGVETTRRVLVRFAPERMWEAKQASIFDLAPNQLGDFDIVYSWGVLHHTGALNKALRCAASFVRPRGLFVFALYRRIMADFFWRWEKRWYSKASATAQARARSIHVALFRLRLRITGHQFSDFLAGYRQDRGMDFYHDVHDWMGGWPYESISPSEVAALMSELGFQQVRSFVSRGRFLGVHSGLFGSGCDEFVYRRI